MKLALKKSSTKPSEMTEDVSIKEKGKMIFGIKGKLILVLSSFSLFIVLVIGIIAFQFSKSAIEEQAFNQLKSIKETKKKAIKDYFKQIKNQILTLSEDLATIEAVKGFSKEFKYLDTSFNLNSIEQLKQNIIANYSSSFIPKLNQNSKEKVNPENFLPISNNAIVAQNILITKNIQPELNDSTPSSLKSYVSWHDKEHTNFESYLQKFGYYDIYLINLQGDIVYSVFKEVDFGTNLLQGPYKNTNFADVYRKALNANNPEYAVLEDFEFYEPSYNAPASFIASPIFDKGKKVGVLVFQMPIDNINSIMTGDEQWESDGLGKTGETYLIGSDEKMRSISRFL